MSFWTNKDDENKNTLKSTTAGVIDRATTSQIDAAAKKFHKPDYNPQTRKAYYDDGAAHKTAMDNAFANGKTPKDPYTGADLVKKHNDAKIKYGDDWQNHAAEADHIDPLNKLVKRHKDDAWTTMEDLKEVGNSQDNFQVMSKRTNQGSKNMGKGGDSQEEWANNPEKVKGLKENNVKGQGERAIKNKIKKQDTQKLNDDKLSSKKINNIMDTAHSAGIQGAKYGGGAALTVSGITNLVAVMKGEKNIKDALIDTGKSGAVGAAGGYVMSAGMTTLCHTMSTSSSTLIQALAKNNVPGKILTTVMITGSTLTQFAKGEITAGQCLAQLGENGVNFVASSYGAVVGQALIPIPVVGATIGALVGSVLTSTLIKGLDDMLKQKQLEHEERLRIIAECQAAVKAAKMFRAELEANIEAYFAEHRACFSFALESIQLSFKNGDADGVIQGANQITKKLGGSVQFETVSEFKSFLDSDEVFKL